MPSDLCSFVEGIRLFFDEEAIDADVARALSHAMDHIDIYSNSWGPGDKGFEVSGPNQLVQRTLQRGTEKVMVLCYLTQALPEKFIWNGYRNDK